MKTKKIERKLSFSKETVVNLNNDELNAIYGGTNFTRAYDCETLPKVECQSVPWC